MRVWVDITDASHVLFFAPVVRRLEDEGHMVTVTARRFASADVLLRRYGLAAMLTMHHRGGGLGTRAVGLVNRTAQLISSASSGRFDVAVGSHASDLALTAWTLGIPQMTLLDDERLRRTNAVNLHLVDEVAVPDAIPPATLAALGAPAEKLFRYPGFKEEYYLYDFRPDPDVLKRLGVDRRHVVGIVRPARPARGAASSDDEAALAALTRTLAGRRNVTLVLIARDDEQRRRVAAAATPGLVVPAGPLDAVSLIAAADFMLGDGGAMTREAAALGTPAYTVAAHPAAAVDAALLTAGRVKYVAAPEDVRLHKKDARTGGEPPRDPQLFVDAITELARRRYRRARLGRLARDIGDNEPSQLL